MSDLNLSAGHVIGGSARSEGWRGLRAAFPVMLGFVPFALVLGSKASQTGFSSVEVPLMTAQNFGGGSEFAAVELWTSPPHVLLIVAITFLVNSRHLLMGAAMAPLPGNGDSRLSRRLPYQRSRAAAPCRAAGWPERAPGVGVGRRPLPARVPGPADRLLRDHAGLLPGPGRLAAGKPALLCLRSAGDRPRRRLRPDGGSGTPAASSPCCPYGPSSACSPSTTPATMTKPGMPSNGPPPVSPIRSCVRSRR